MYVCNNCGRTFDETKVSKELMGEYWGTPAYEYYDVCPYCGDSDIDEIEEEEE